MKNQNIRAEIITIGDEILIGQIIDTNSAWIAQQLNAIGIDIAQITSISDDKAHIINALNEASLRADLVLVTGGLGPTKDDITKQTISEYFQSPLVRNTEVLNHITALLEPRKVQLNELNIKQADIPEKSEVLHNALGTAPGLWLQQSKLIFVFMPGVPFEMKYIVSEQLLPRLKIHFQTPAIVHKTLMLQGIAESMLAQHIEKWEQNIHPCVKLAYLPSPGLIRLRLTAKGDSEANLQNVIETECDKLKPLIEDWYFADDDETIEITIGKLLKNRNISLSVAESCTGGKIAHLITSVPGSSEYFKGGVVAYANEVKENILGVDSKLISLYGAVSKEVVESMAINVRQKLNTTVSVATSGIAGPEGGTPEKPVGNVWIAISSEKSTISKKLSLGDSNRERNIQRSTLTVLGELRKFILTHF